MTDAVSAALATASIVLLYFVAGFATKDRWGGTWFLQPLKITAHVNGRGSLSRTQVFFFTLIFIWISIYWLLKSGELLSIDDSIVFLLGIAVAGAGLGRVADTTRFRVSGENWAWAVDKGWILRDFSKAAEGAKPRLKDLFTSDQGFEVGRFQAVAFSAVVGFALLYNGATAESLEEISKYTIAGEYLTLIGISQGVYVGGKLTGGNLIGDLNEKLDDLRKLELTFNKIVANSEDWLRSAPGQRSVQFAREKIASDEYRDYMAVASTAAAMVHELTGVKVKADRVEPRLPL